MIKLILKLKETQIDEFNLEKSMINIGRSCPRSSNHS